jgi:hypothetical protein
MKLIKLEALLMITIIGVITACNQPQSKDALIANNAVSLTDATLEGDELIKTNFGDIQLNQSYITKESIAKLNDQMSLQRAI